LENQDGFLDLGPLVAQLAEHFQNVHSEANKAVAPWTDKALGSRRYCPIPGRQE
jgi:hypothetical protein